MPALVAEMRDLEERIALHRKAIAAVCDSMVRVVSQYGEADSVAAPLTEPRDRVAEELAALRSDFDLVESLQREVVQLRGEVQRRDTLGPAIHGLIQATDYLETAAREIRSVPGLGESAEAVTAVASVAYRRLLEVLLRFGVRRVRTRRGDAFDPALHEIAQSRPSEDPAWVGRIAAVIKPAFVDGTGRVERHALVDVYVGC